MASKRMTEETPVPMSWVYAGIVITTAAIIFIYSNFEARGSAGALEEKIEKRLDRIEDKQDALMAHFQIELPKKPAPREP